MAGITEKITAFLFGADALAGAVVQTILFQAPKQLSKVNRQFYPFCWHRNSPASGEFLGLWRDAFCGVIQVAVGLTCLV